MRLFLADKPAITKVFRIVLFICTALLLPGHSALAFDDDRTISNIHLKDESFLDINAHQFRKSLDLLWLDTTNGWRATGGSVSTDRLFLYNEFRFYKQLFDAVAFGMRFEQENFYARKPTPLPLIFIDVYPQPEHNVGVSIVGTPAYDKRQSDMGYAITIGRLPTNYSRLTWLKVDKYYNEKNEFDDSYYDRFAETWMLEGTYKTGREWIVHYDLKKDTPSDFIYDNQSSRFRHKSHDYKFSLVYLQSKQRFTGINIRSLNTDKYLLETPNNEGQKVDYHMLDLYWLDLGFDGNRELTLGFRYDSFKERLRDYLVSTNSYDFRLTTWQAYATLLNGYTLNQAWELGLYLGWSDRYKQYTANTRYEFDDEGIQAKLRTSWQYQSVDRSSALVITMTFNLDDLIDDPGDGGGIYLQTRF